MIKEDFGMLSVIICEDEPIQTTLLVKLVQQWADQCALPVQILSYPNAESFLFSYEEQPFGDILLLDIQMAQMNGMELARKIRERNRRIQITFLTGLPVFMTCCAEALYPELAGTIDRLFPLKLQKLYYQLTQEVSYGKTNISGRAL